MFKNIFCSVINKQQKNMIRIFKYVVLGHYPKMYVAKEVCNIEPDQKLQMMIIQYL